MITVEERLYLHNKMIDLLDEYDYSYTDDAISDIIDKWANQKALFIEAFKKHPNYIDGQFMIAFDTDYEREIDKVAINNFANWMYGYM